MADVEEVPAAETEPAEKVEEVSEDDRRAAAATANRKRALEDWEEKKRRWRDMGVPPAMPGLSRQVPVPPSPSRESWDSHCAGCSTPRCR